MEDSALSKQERIQPSLNKRGRKDVPLLIRGNRTR